MRLTVQNSFRTPRPARDGFTIVELMVVVSLIALLLGFSVPLVFKIDELSRDRSGVNSFGVAVTAARAYATRRIADLDGVPMAEYSGAAVLVTPNNQLRIIEDVQNNTMETQQLSEYRDVLRMESVTMPRGMGVVGIVRTSSAQWQWVAPPFCIRFNGHGQLVSEANLGGTAEEKRNLVFYDGDYNGTVNTASVRTSGYDPSNYDPDLKDISSQFDANRNQYRLPFEGLECVVGVVVYSKADFEDAGGRINNWPNGTVPSLGCKDGTCNSIQEWMVDNGSVLFFSRNTGAIVRTKRQ